MGKEARLQKTFICDPKKYLGRKHDDEDATRHSSNVFFEALAAVGPRDGIPAERRSNGRRRG